MKGAIKLSSSFNKARAGCAITQVWANTWRNEVLVPTKLVNLVHFHMLDATLIKIRQLFTEMNRGSFLCSNGDLTTIKSRWKWTAVHSCPKIWHTGQTNYHVMLVERNNKHRRSSDSPMSFVHQIIQNGIKSVPARIVLPCRNIRLPTNPDGFPSWSPLISCRPLSPRCFLDELT